MPVVHDLASASSITCGDSPNLNRYVHILTAATAAGPEQQPACGRSSGKRGHLQRLRAEPLSFRTSRSLPRRNRLVPRRAGATSIMRRAGPSLHGPVLPATTFDDNCPDLQFELTLLPGDPEQTAIPVSSDLDACGASRQFD